VPAPDGVCLVMDVPGRMIRVQNESFDVRRVEMEHARFMMIDPDDGMIVMVIHSQNLFGNSVRRSRDGNMLYRAVRHH
jgi:hypothetical protein